MKTKLVFLISSMVSGGAERVVCSLSNSFYLKGYEVVIVLLNACDKMPYPLESGVKVVSINKVRRDKNIFKRLGLVIFTAIKLFNTLKTTSPNLVFSFQTTANFWTGFVCSILRIPYVVSERTTPDRTVNKLPFIHQRLLAALYKRAKAIVVPSVGIMNCLKQNRLFSDLKNIILIKNHVSEVETFSEEKIHGNKYILGAGRLEYVKGFDRLIDAFAKVKTPDVDLIIAGNGIEKTNLARKISELRLDNRVFLVGEKQNIYDYYKQCEVFVLPSRNEGYPNALIEAMSAGCACIAIDCDFGPSEIINHQQNGLLVDEKNIAFLPNLMDEVLDCPDLKTRISHKAKEILVTNSHMNIVAEWEDLISKYA